MSGDVSYYNRYSDIGTLLQYQQRQEMISDQESFYSRSQRKEVQRWQSRQEDLDLRSRDELLPRSPTSIQYHKRWLRTRLCIFVCLHICLDMLVLDLCFLYASSPLYCTFRRLSLHRQVIDENTKMVIMMHQKSG